MTEVNPGVNNSYDCISTCDVRKRIARATPYLVGADIRNTFIELQHFLSQFFNCKDIGNIYQLLQIFECDGAECHHSDCIRKYEASLFEWVDAAFKMNGDI